MDRLESLSPSKLAPLERFSTEEQATIQERLQILSSLVYLIGKDYKMAIEVNSERGWHWDFNENVVRVDPDDLLNKPIEFLRFVMSHEAGHRRISRVTDVIPDEVWNQPGFAFMMNAIEDPRDNNFVADTTPHFKDEMRYAYGPESDEAAFETAMKEKAEQKLGTKPRFMQAGFEYIRLWYQISIGEDPVIKDGLPDDVRDVVLKTLPAARQSWNTYPTYQEAEEGVVMNGKKLSGEETIVAYAKKSFEINHNFVWPLFKTLIDKDKEDQKNKQQKPGDKSSGQEPAHGNENSGVEPDQPLSPEDIEEIINELAEELADFFASKLPQSAKSEKSDENATLEAGEKLAQEKLAEGEKQEIVKKPIPDDKSKQLTNEKPIVDLSNIDTLIRDFQSKERESVYEEVLREHGDLIDQLTFELQDIFNKRRHTGWESGFKSGKKINISKAIQEEVRDVSPFETGAFMRREQPQEADYVVNLLVDLSGSMRKGGKIKEAFKAAAILSEVLQNIGIKFYVAGFNRQYHDFKKYGEELDDSKRQGFSEILSQVDTSDAAYNDDGWALDIAYHSVLTQEERQKIIFVISDGVPEPYRDAKEYELSNVVKQVTEGGVKLIGLGLGRGTDHVTRYYPHSVANIEVRDLPKVLGQKLREVIEQG